MVEHRSGARHDVNKRNSDSRGLHQQNLMGSETSGQQIRNQYVILKPVVFSPAYGQRNNQQSKSEVLQENVFSNNNCKQYPHNADENCKNDRKLFQSKIPVFKGRSKLQPLNNKNVQNSASDSSLSAADRRQKYHQSRLRCSYGEPQMIPLQPVQCCRILPALPLQVAVPSVPFLHPKVNLQKLPKIQKKQHHNNCPPASILEPSKVVLSTKAVPIKKDVPIATTAVDSKKKKGLPGEFTHFPALCNISHVRHPKKNTYVSSVPHLPPILPPPAPPPPSVSASLEQEVK